MTPTEQFAAMHRPGSPLILYNAWDAGSARAVEAAGASVIATGSWSVAAALGAKDGEAIGFGDLLSVVQRIRAACDLPLTVDMERGYADEAEELSANARQLAACGVVGINIEDGLPDGTLRPSPEQSARIRAVREAAPALFVNARTDTFFARTDHAAATDEAMRRAHDYAAAGAGCLFVPGLTDTHLIRSVCERSPLPVNVMVPPGEEASSALTEAGVARISYGPGPYGEAMAYLTERAARAFSREGRTP